MPEINARQVQKDLETHPDSLWPVYWLVGTERLKVRELTRRIRRAVTGQEDGPPSLNEETLDGSQLTGADVADAASAFAFGPGPRFLIIRDAHLIKDPDALEALLGKGPVSREDLTSVCVFQARDLDKRRKITQKLLKSAAVVPCEDVAETERAAWLDYLAKRRGIELTFEVRERLSLLEPWSLEMMERELEKLSLGGPEVLTGASRTTPLGVPVAEAFLDACLSRRKTEALRLLGDFAEDPQEAIPLVGLLAWNVRQLSQCLGPHAQPPALGPYLVAKLQRWRPHWTLSEILTLESALADLDFAQKQTFQSNLGAWTTLVNTAV